MKLKLLLAIVSIVAVNITTAFCQCKLSAKKDTVKMITINYIESEKETKSQLFFYAYYDHRLYDITEYLLNKKNDCLPSDLKSLDAIPSSSELVRILLTSKLHSTLTSEKKRFKQIIGWNCMDVYASFFIFPCSSGGFVNPLEKHIERDSSICFTSVISKPKKTGIPGELSKILKNW